MIQPDPLANATIAANERVLRIATARRHAATGTGRAIREQARVSAQEIADALDVSLVTVTRWERGQSAPRGDAAIRWVDLLDQLQQQTAT